MWSPPTGGDFEGSHYEGVVGIDFVGNSFGAMLAASDIGAGGMAGCLAIVDSVSHFGYDRKCPAGTIEGYPVSTGTDIRISPQPLGLERCEEEKYLTL